MARLNTEGITDIIRDMELLGEKSGDVAKAMITAGAEEVVTAWKDAIESAGHVDTGSMRDSVGYADIMGGREKYVDVFPQGTDAKGKRNVEKAFILHYGWSRRTGSHFVDDAERDGENNATLAMTDVWDEFIETGQVPYVAATSKVGKASDGKGITKKKGK